MKQTYLILIMTLVWSCTSQSQSLNTEIAEQGKKPHLLGKIDKTGLTSSNYKHWFLSQFNDYQLNEEVIDKIQSKLRKYDILVFMGTWCGDSRREVPRFYKVLEAAKFPMDQLTMIAVSRKPTMYKQSPGHEERGLNIHRVPTFIFYKKGKEIHRIVESPVKSLEEDILNILEGDYQSNYEIVNQVSRIVNDKDFYDKALKSISSYKQLAKNMYELNTYARLLSTQNKTEQAIQVFKLNTILFPDQPRTYMSLANTLGANGHKERAVKVLTQALDVHPNHKGIQENLTMIKSN